MEVAEQLMERAEEKKLTPQVSGAGSPEQAIIETWTKGPEETQRLAELCATLTKGWAATPGREPDVVALVAPVKGLARGFSVG